MWMIFCMDVILYMSLLLLAGSWSTKTSLVVPSSAYDEH